MPQVSVIIPTHNRPHLLPRAVESALSAGTNIEVIVVDDASNDDTAKMCRTLAGIKYIRLDLNQGVAGARNIGILQSTGDYISFLDDDDARINRLLDLQVEALASMPEAGLIYGQALIANQNGLASADYYPQRCPQGDVFWELMGQNFIPCGTVVFRRSCLLRIGLLDQAVPGIDDWDLWIRIASLYPVLALEQPVMIWRQSTPVSGQGTSSAAELVTMSTRQLRRKWLRLPRAASAPASVRRDAWRQFSKNVVGQLAFETARALSHRQFFRARNNILAALRWHPWASVRAATSAAAIRHLWGRVKENQAWGDRSSHSIQNQPDRSE
jgi:hypothetical protein